MSRLRSGTLATRMASVSSLCRHISALPCAVEKRLAAINMKALPKAIFGCQVTPCTAKALRSLGSSLKAALHVGNVAMSNPRLVFACWGRKSPYPVKCVMFRRVKSLRRMYHSRSQSGAQLDEIMQALVQSGMPGALSEGLAFENISDLCVDTSWDIESPSEARAMGPVSLMLPLARIGARVNGDWQVFIRGLISFNIMMDLWAVVVDVLQRAYQGSVVSEAAASRGSLGDHPSVDWWAATRHAKEWYAADKHFLDVIISVGSGVITHGGQRA